MCFCQQENKSNCIHSIFQSNDLITLIVKINLKLAKNHFIQILNIFNQLIIYSNPIITNLKTIFGTKKMFDKKS